MMEKRTSGAKALLQSTLYTARLNPCPSYIAFFRSLLGFVEEHRSRRWRGLRGNVSFFDCLSIGAQLKGVLSPDLPVRSIGNFQGMGSFHLHRHGRSAPELHFRAVEFAHGWF